MDDVANINPKKNASLAMMLEAARREWEVYTFDTTDLFADKDGVYAHASQTTVADNLEHWFEKQPSQIMALSETPPTWLDTVPINYNYFFY